MTILVCRGEGIGWVANEMSFAGAAFDWLPKLLPGKFLMKMMMKILSVQTLAWLPVIKKIEPYLLALVLLMVWFTAPELMELGDSTAGYIDQGARRS